VGSTYFNALGLVIQAWRSSFKVAFNKVFAQKA
jgi:hypothetical protein